MAKAVASSSVVTGAKMTPPSITLLPDKKSPTNSHSSPARTGKNTPSNTEKKAHMNGHASPSHLAANVSSSHGGKPILEGYMKTDDRMRLAKERREERERSLVAREQLIREKERRARLQYERTVEERWRRLEEQRLKEDLRRAAVEEKRRQKLEEERERFEALMKRSLERSLQLEQRTKRWGRGCHPGAGDCENAPLPFSAASAFSHGIASPIPAVSESAPCSPHRSPFHSSVNHADHNRAGLQGGSQSTPNTPKKERLRRERRTASPGCGSPVRRSESPASITKHLASPTASKLASKIRAQSPSNAHQYHYSPTRQHPGLSDDRKAENDKVGKKGEQTKAEIAAKKNADINRLNSSPPAQKNMLSSEIAKTKSSNMYLKGDASDKNQSPERRNQMASKADPSEKKTQSNLQDGDKKKESASCTGKVAAGTSDAEEASRLLAERRRQARAQKELEEKKREQEEEERLREEQLRKQLAQVQQWREPMNQQVKERGKSEEDPHLKEEEKRKKEQQEKELQAQMDREREKAKVQAQEDVERQRQDRELQTQQEEEERLQRKKRIEEIMKRTRKGEAESKTEDQVETKCVSPPGDIKTVQSNAQVKEQVTVQVKTKDSALRKTDAAAAAAAAAAAQMDSQKQVKSNSHLMTHSVPDKKSETKQTSEVISSLLKVAKVACVLKQEGEEVGINVNQQHRASVNVTDQIKREPRKLRGEGGMMNSGGKGEGSALTSTDLRAEVSKQQSVDVPAAGGKDKGGSQVKVVRPPVAPLPIGNLAPPVIKLEPLDVKHTGSCDEVQSMEVSPASKEELISIPEYSPVNEIQSNGMSNTRALEELMDLTGSITYVKLSTESTVGDCNKNLIEGVVSPVSDSQLMGVAPPSSNKLSIK